MTGLDGDDERLAKAKAHSAREPIRLRMLIEAGVRLPLRHGLAAPRLAVIHPRGACSSRGVIRSQTARGSTSRGVGLRQLAADRGNVATPIRRAKIGERSAPARRGSTCFRLDRHVAFRAPYGRSNWSKTDCRNYGCSDGAPRATDWRGARSPHATVPCQPCAASGTRSRKLAPPATTVSTGEPHACVPRRPAGAPAAREFNHPPVGGALRDAAPISVQPIESGSAARNDRVTSDRLPVRNGAESPPSRGPRPP